MITSLPPLSLYVHLPWCISKCPYCDFNSHRAGDAPPRQRYVAAVLADLNLEAAHTANRKIQSVFIGGGTPSLFDADEIGTILQAADDMLGLQDQPEITMEVNPGTIEHGDLKGYRAAGVTRVSIGAQSFVAGSLQRLGRIHGPDEIETTVAGALDAGFDNINLDIMFALPGQDLAMARRDVERAIELSPQHISYYQLTLEPNTRFYSKPPDGLPDDDLAWEIQQQGHALLQAGGYRQYEISAFAKPGHQCLHNMNYWQFGDYLAVGAGAHGKFTDLAGTIRRYRKPAHPTAYIEQGEMACFDATPQSLGGADSAFEFMMNSLRLRQGFSEEAFIERTGQELQIVQEVLAKAQSDQLLESDEMGYWRATDLGLRFLNDLQERFLPENLYAQR